MGRRELALLVGLVAAAAAVVIGVAMIHQPAAWIVAGVLGAALCWLAVGEIGGGPAQRESDTL